MKFKLLVYYKLLRYSWYTLRFNLTYFSGRTAYTFPVVFYCKPKLISLKGKVEITGIVHSRMIGFGYPGNSMKSSQGQIFWDNRGGTVVFKGKMGTNPDFSLRLLDGAKISFGNNCSFGQNNLISCKESITFGDDVLSSWDNQFFDNDFHLFFDIDKHQVITDSKPIEVGSKVFIGARCSLLKGTAIPYRSVVAANSVLNKDYGNTAGSLIGGNPATVKSKRMTLVISEPMTDSELDELNVL